MLLEVKHLNISFGDQHIIKDFSVSLEQSKILAIVGESGSGKSLSVLSLMGLLPRNAKVTADRMRFDGFDVLESSKRSLRGLRGSEMSMIFQEPMSSLNPSMTCGRQVEEVLVNHNILKPKQAKEDVIRLFHKVRLPDPEQTYKKYPHQISGGQKQRVMIAMAIACKPKLLIADEPTTALDVSVQKSILELLKDIQQENNMSVIFISHDLGLVKHIADEVLVMYKGEVVEKAPAVEIFKAPGENYTKALLATRPQKGKRLHRLPTVKDVMENHLDLTYESEKERKLRHAELYSKSPVVEVKEVSKIYELQSTMFKRKTYFKAVDNVSFEVYEGEKLGIVGESGCGKTTLGFLINKLNEASSGEILFKGEDILKLNKKQHKKVKRDIQVIFQDPYSSLNPRMTIGQAIIEPMLVHRLVKNKKEGMLEVYKLLEAVGLSKDHYNRYPHEFSGGQRQRIGIARCLALKPKLIVCDESVSALDISVQAQVLNVLEDLKNKFNLTYIFISHDLSVVRQFCDRILVMQKGRIVEQGEADQLYENPKEDYTKMLIDAMP